jgi:hypothetical protein
VNANLFALFMLCGCCLVAGGIIMFMVCLSFFTQWLRQVREKRDDRRNELDQLISINGEFQEADDRSANLFITALIGLFLITSVMVVLGKMLFET